MSIVWIVAFLFLLPLFAHFIIEIYIEIYDRVSGELKSKLGIDYTPLQELLAMGAWQLADKETAKVMLKASEPGTIYGARRVLDSESIELPCGDLRIIDQLWVEYSQGRFGFSVQKKIWLEMGGKIDYQTEKKLFDRLGWRKGSQVLRWNQLTFNNQKAPMGHLPTLNADYSGEVSYLNIRKKKYNRAKESPYLEFLCRINTCRM